MRDNAWRSRRQREAEGGAAAWLTIGPHPAAVALDDAAHDRQADAGPLVFLTMQSREWLEKGRAGARLEADAVVGNRNGDSAVLGPAR